MPTVTRRAQPTPPGRVVRVDAELHQLTPTQRIVVGISTGLTARHTVAVVRIDAHTQRVASQHRTAEEPVAPAGVATLGCRTSAFVGLPAVIGALGVARIGEVWASCDGAHLTGAGHQTPPGTGEDQARYGATGALVLRAQRTQSG
jgi:hypothetical protein